MHIYPLSRGLEALRCLARLTHTYTLTHTELCLIRQLPSYSLYSMHKSLPCSSSFFYVYLSLHLSPSVCLILDLCFSLSIRLSHPCCLSLRNGANLFSTQRVSVHQRRPVRAKRDGDKSHQHVYLLCVHNCVCVCEGKVKAESTLPGKSVYLQLRNTLTLKSNVT